MSIAELKLVLIRKIIATDDLTILTKIDAVLNNTQQTIHEVYEPTTTYSKTEKVLILNEWQQTRIDISLKQIENGDFISHEEDQLELEKWFQEQEK